MDWRVHGLGKVEGGGGVSTLGGGSWPGGGSAIGGGGNGTLSAFAALGTGRLPWGCLGLSLGCFSKLQPFPPNLGSSKF